MFINEDEVKRQLKVAWQDHGARKSPKFHRFRFGLYYPFKFAFKGLILRLDERSDYYSTLCRLK